MPLCLKEHTISLRFFLRFFFLLFFHSLKLECFRGSFQKKIWISFLIISLSCSWHVVVVFVVVKIWWWCIILESWMTGDFFFFTSNLILHDNMKWYSLKRVVLNFFWDSNRFGFWIFFKKFVSNWKSSSTTSSKSRSINSCWT